MNILSFFVEGKGLFHPIISVINSLRTNNKSYRKRFCKRRIAELGYEAPWVQRLGKPRQTVKSAFLQQSMPKLMEK